MTDSQELLQALLAETLPTIQAMTEERYGSLAHPHQEPAPYLDNRPPFTPALMKEAGWPACLHRTLLSLRGRPTGPATCSPTPAFSSARPAPSTTGANTTTPGPAYDRRTHRHRRAIERSRTHPDGGPPVSPETYIEHRIILAVIGDRRRTKLWAGWWKESRDIIDQVMEATNPSRRQRLEAYAAMRATVRRRRRTHILAEHITDLDGLLEAFH